jgi:hypothetical protein
MLQIIIEECTRSGVHIGYHKIERLPVRIGRAFDNDIVIADPYLSPVHLIIEKDDNGWIAVDQGSENGTYIGKDRKIHGTAELVSGDQVNIGRSQLRIWSPGHPVPRELRLPARQSFTRRIVVPSIAILSLIGVFAALSINQFLGNASRTKSISIFASALSYLFFPLLWAATCACAGFIVRRRAHFALQLIVANCALVSILALTSLAEYVDYFSCSTNAADITQYTGIALITIVLLFINFSITTGAADLRRAIISVVIGGGVIATVALTDFAARFENHITPEYSQTLKPPYARITKSISLDQFLNKCGSLFGGTMKPAENTRKE